MSNPTPSQPTMARHGRAIRVAIGALAAALGLAGFAPAAMSAAQAAPATPTVTTTINATALSTTKINIYDVSTSPVTYEGLFGTTSVLSLSLPPGQYQFNVGGLALSCEPTLDSGGTWTVPSSCGSAASGGGTLTLGGVPVRLDALKINDHVYVLSYGEPSVAAGATATKRLMPGSYDLQPGSGMVAYCRFSLDASDDVTLSACASAAAASGSTIFFTGTPVTMAATALDTGVVLAANSSAGVKAHKKATLRLMPSPDGYSLVPAAGSVSACYFTLANSGGVTVTHCGSSASASGSRVTFTGFPVALNATKLSTTHYVIEDALQLDGILQSSATVHHYRLLSGSYGFGVGAGYVAHFGWTVTKYGQISYPPIDSLFLAGKGTGTLTVRGFQIKINATALGKGTFTLDPDIFAHSYSQATVHTLRLVPSGYGFTSTTNPPGPWPHNIGWTVTLTGTVRLPVPKPACAWAVGNTLVIDCTPPTFTEVSGSPNPVSTDQPFTVTALECDRVADVQATGTMTVVDVTTGHKLGTVALSPSPRFVNCGRARVTDHEKGLLPGHSYKITATYTPGGTIPVPASAPAHYNEAIAKQ